MSLIRTLALALAGASSLSAATRIWDGGDPANTNWNDPDNWDAAAAAGDDLIFPSGISAGDKATVNNFTAGTVFRSLGFQDIGYAVGGNGFTLGGAAPRFITVSSGIGTATVSVPVTLAGDATFSSTNSRSTLRFTQPITLSGNKLTLHAATGPIVLEEDIGSAGQIEKTGTGTATLGENATVTVSSDVNVIGGRLVVNGELNHFIALGGTGRLAGTGLMGEGYFLGSVEPGGTAFPDYGTMAFAGPITFDAGSTYVAEISVGSSDRINVGGTVTLMNTSTLSPLVPEVIAFPLGASFTVLDQGTAGPINGTFGNAPQGGTVSAGRVTFSVNYQAGGGSNNLALTVTDIAPSGITRVWDGGGANDLWSTAANWVGDVAPGGGDALLFPAGAARPVSVNDFPAGFVLSGLTIQSGAYQFSGNAFALDGPVTTAPHDSDLTFSLPFQLLPQGITVPAVTHTGSRALNLGSAMTTGGVSTGVQLNNLAPSGPGLRFRGTIDSSGSPLVILRDDSPAPFEVELSAPIQCGNLVFIEGDVELKGSHVLSSSGSTLVGDPGGLFLLSGGPATVTTSGLGGGMMFASLLQPSSLTIASGSKLVSKAGASVAFNLPSVELRGDASIEGGAGGMTWAVVGTATTAAGADARIDVPVAGFSGGSGFNLAGGSNLRLAGTSTFMFPTTDVSVSGGGTLRLTGGTATGTFTVAQDSTLRLDGPAAGSAVTNVTLGNSGTAGHLTGTGTAKDVVIATPGCTVSPGTASAPYGIITCDRLESSGPSFDYVYQIGGTVPGVSHDQIVVREAVDYADMDLLSFDISPGFAPPAGTAVSVVDPDAGCTIGSPLPDFVWNLLGQKFMISFAGGDGNDFAFTKQAVPPPLMGSAAGLPAPFIQPAVPPALPTYEIPLKGEAGLDYRLEYSTDLEEWTLSPTVYTAPTGGIFTPSFPISPQLTPKLFFRMRPK